VLPRSVKSNDGAVDEKTLMKQYRNTINVSTHTYLEDWRFLYVRV
jgi:hypothetical protein